MKCIKIIMLTFALITSTTAIAQSHEELCHNAAESDVEIKRSLQKDPNSFKDFLQYIDEAEKNPTMRNALREKKHSGFITASTYLTRMCGGFLSFVVLHLNPLSIV